MEQEKSLEPGALVSKLANTVKDKINNLLADGVVTPGIVVGRVLLAGDELLGVEELPVDASPDLVNHGGLEVHKHGPGHVLTRPSLGEESVEGVIASPNGLIRGHLTIRLDAMLEAVKLPAGVTNLGASLADVDRNTFPLKIQIKLVVR